VLLANILQTAHNLALDPNLKSLYLKGTDFLKILDARVGRKKLFEQGPQS
jgi:hypothetical protein